MARAMTGTPRAASKPQARRRNIGSELAAGWATAPSPSLPRRTGEGVTAKQGRVGAEGGGVSDRPVHRNLGRFQKQKHCYDFNSRYFVNAL